MRSIAIIGAGAAGMSAARAALDSSCAVTLFEKNRQCGRKICITGKGRCNLTNDSEVGEFLGKVVNGGKFLYSALYSHTPRDTMAAFEAMGVPLQVERGARVFPVSQRAQDVRDALLSALVGRSGFTLKHTPVRTVSRNTDGRFSINSAPEIYDAVILATGGLSYPLTGSTGDGHHIATALGHTIVDCSASLVRLVCNDSWICEVEGLSLKNVTLTLTDTGRKKPLFSQQGELVFTADGISGPLALSASAFVRQRKGQLALSLNFKPALSAEELDARILRDFGAESNRIFKNSLDALLPSAMRPVFVRLSGIDPQLKVHQITRERRARLVSLFTRFPLSFARLGPLEEAVVTAGGVSLSEIDPHTMQSRLCPGLYFAGEVMDVDALTGGYNLQIAFSTGTLAGKAAAEER